MVAYRRNRTLPATAHRPERLFYGVNFRPTPELNPFLLSRKADMVRPVPRAQGSRKTMRTIKSVEYVGELPTRCIAIDHPDQLFLAGDALVPTHNTRTATEWVLKQVRNHPGCRIAILGRTSKEVRDVMVYGVSGLLNVGHPDHRPTYRPSEARLVWPQFDNAQAFLYSAEVPDAPRGNAFEYYLCDELASHSPYVGADGLTAYQNVVIATREGEKPYGVITTTPKRVKVLRELLDRSEQKGDVLVVRGKTTENSALSDTYMEQMRGTFEGTALAAQELDGEMLDESPEGALWTPELLDQHRWLAPDPPRLPLKVIAVDPSVAEKPRDECGIVVVGATDHRQLHKRQAYVLADRSLRGSPEEWAKVVVDTYREFGANAVIVEMNQGQHLVKMALQSLDPLVKIIGVQATQGKRLRAEPTTLPYQQGRVHHVGYFPELEDQLTTWEPELHKYSPDRLDALVHGITATMIKPPRELRSHKLTARSHGSRQLPTASPTAARR